MPTVSENHDESQKSIGRLMGQMEIVLRAIQDHHSEAQNSRQRMFIKLDEQAATQAAQAERLALLEQEVRPMKDAVEDYLRFRSNAKGFIGAATFFVAIMGAALSHLIAALIVGQWPYAIALIAAAMLLGVILLGPIYGALKFRRRNL